jgi:RNA-binding protein
LDSKQRGALRALAHHLEPVVQVGKAGATEGVLAQIREQLAAHELIKVRFAREAPQAAAEAAVEIAAATRSHVVQTAGRVLSLYRRHDHKPKIQLPGKGEASEDTSRAVPAQKRDPKVSLNRKHKARRDAQRRNAEQMGEGGPILKTPRARPRSLSSVQGSEQARPRTRSVLSSLKGAAGSAARSSPRRARVLAAKGKRGGR